MRNEDVVRQWLDDPENPELIEQVERIADEGGDPVLINDEYIRRVAEQGETRREALQNGNTPTRPCPPVTPARGRRNGRNDAQRRLP